MVWGCKQVGSSGMCLFLFEVFHFTPNGTCCRRRATSTISSALLLSLAVNKKSVLRGGGTHQPLKVEQRDRLTGHKTKQFASCGGSEAAKRNVFFHTFFFPHSSHQIFRRCASENAAPAASVSVQSYHWQILTTVFLRCAAQRG